MGSPAIATMRRPAGAAVTGVLAAALLAACGASSEGSGDTDPATLAPPDSPLYVEAVVDPEGEQEGAVDALLARFPELGDPSERIPELIDEALASEDSSLTYSEDIEPWLGDRIGLFISGYTAGEEDADGAVVVATTDEEAARAALDQDLEGAEERSYEEVDYLYDEEDDAVAGIIDGFLVAGSESGFQAAVDAAAGEGLVDSERFGAALETAEGDPLATLYFDTAAFVDIAAESDPTFDAQAGALFQAFSPSEPTVATLTAEEDALVIDSTQSGLPTPTLGAGADILSELPGDSWLAFGAPEVGDTVSAVLDAVEESGGPSRDVIESGLEAETGLDLERDLLAWMGDLGIFVRGTALLDIGGGVVVETTDPVASGRALEAVERLLRAEGEVAVAPPSVAGVENGFSVTGPGAPQAVQVVQADGRVVAAYGEPATADGLDPTQPLADDPQFTAAADGLGSDYELSTLVEIAPIVELASNFGAESDPGFTEARPYLERFSHIAVGTRQEGDALLTRTRIELE